MAQAATGTYATGSWVDPLWVVGYSLFGLAALVYVEARSRGEVVRLTEWGGFYHRAAGTGRLIHRLVPFAAIILVGSLAVRHFLVKGGGTPLEDAIMAALSFLIPLVALTRQLLVEIENTRLQTSLMRASAVLEDRVVERTQELAAEKDRLDTLNRASREISRCVSVEEVLRAGIALIARLTDCAVVAALAPGPQGAFRFVSAENTPETTPQALQSLLRGFYVANSDYSDTAPLLLQSLPARATLDENGSEPPARTLKTAVFPMVSKQVLLGAACLAGDHVDCNLLPEETDLVVNIVSQMAVAVESASRYDDARFLAENDALTGLANRRSISARLDQEITRAERTHSPFALLMMDVDDFKCFNDTYGHETGDKVLVSVAESLREAVRGGDVLGRYGGDEFVAVLPDTDLLGARHVVDRIAHSLSTRVISAPDGRPLRPHVSCGVAVYPVDGTAAQDLFRVADVNMYLAKRPSQGRQGLPERHRAPDDRTAAAF